MSISAPFIHRPVATALLTLGLALAGTLAYQFLPVSPLPQVEFPTIQVSSRLPGANPETMASSVATPLERQFGRIAGLTEMTSSSSLGSTSITLQFDLSRDIDGAARDVQAAINAARGQLPANLPGNPTYRKVNPADAPILILALTSDRYDTARMYDAAASILQQKLSEVKGVGQVLIGGGSLPAVRVDVNPTFLNNYSLGLEDVRSALSSANANRPKGEISNSQRTWSLDATDQLLRAADYQPLLVAIRNGGAVRLSDVANVSDSVEDIRASGLTNGKPAVSIILFREPGANIIETVDSVLALMPALKSSIPPAMNLAVALDRTTTIRASVLDTEKTLIISIILVILVVFVFLRNLRATLIPGVAVPVSLVGTFGVMYLLGYSVDNLSLMALTIATGLVVDDAIVVIENISRHLERGMLPLDAALLGAKEIGFTVISISVSLIAVFIPILLMGGIVGHLFREFAVTLSVAVAVSMLVSLTTTPMMCAHLLKARDEVSHGRLYWATERAFDWVLSLYERTLSWVLMHHAVTMLVTLSTIALTAYLYGIVPKGFFPQQDTGRLTGQVQADQSTSFQAMKQRMIQFSDTAQRDPAVQNLIAFTGGGGTINTGRMFVALKPLDERKVTSDEVIARLRNRLSRIPSATLYLQPVQDLRIGGRPSASQYQFTLSGDNLKELSLWAPRVVRKLKELPGLVDVISDQQDRGLEETLDIDRASASRIGISTQTIDDALYDAFGQRQVSTTYTQLNQYHVVMEVDPRFWQSPEALDYVYIKGQTGSQAPLGSFVRHATSNAPLAVNHSGQFPSTTVSFNLIPGFSLGTAVAEIEQGMAELGLPSGIHGSFQGTAQAFESSLANQPLLILAALVTVYIVLGMLYENLIHPITILSTLPSAGIGAFLALLVCRTDLSVIALIGMLLLIGIVKKNAIMMIDFALDAERSRKQSPEEAIFQACLLRFRPIMMTTMAALFGGLALALGTGAGSELRRPLGIVIVGGLVFSQLLTLYTTPVAYLYLDRLRYWLKELRIGTAGRLTTVFLLCLGMTACNLAPKYKAPLVSIPPAFKELPTHEWKMAQPNDEVLRGKWWEMFQDPQLNALEEQVNISNQNIAQVAAVFREARSAVRIARSAQFPSVTASGSITGSRISSNRGGFATGSTSDFQLPIDVSYEADVWGRIRNTVSANVAGAQANAADVETVKVSMHAELAVDYFELRGFDRQKQLLDSTIAAFDRALQLTKNRYAQGIASQVDVAQAQTQLDQTVAQSTDLGVQRAQLEHAIAILIGKPPAELTIIPAFMNYQPPVIPVGIPSELLERRPDIASAERHVASANAQIGIAKAAFYPTVTLGGTLGFESSSITNWFAWPSRFFSVGPSVVETIFDAGRRRAVTEQAQAAYDATVAGYRQSVLSAFQDVEDNLAALHVLDQEAQQQAAAVNSAERSVVLATDRYKGGITTYLEVTTAQATALANQRTAVDIQTRRMTATVLLIKALGGGWDSSGLPSDKDLKSKAAIKTS